jgi:hypothetical protein
VLYLDSQVGPINGLTIFRDHAQDDLFYYINERPRLAVNNGVPEMIFLKYKRDITDNPNMAPEDKERLGGGFLAFTVDLGVDETVLKDAKSKIGAANLVPVLFQKGTVRLSIAKDVAAQPDAPAGGTPGAAFFEAVLGATKPSLVGDNRATFGVVLDHEGATMVEAALKAGMSPIGVIYDLEYLGLRPAFEVSIHADYKRVYTELDIQFGVKAAYGPIAVAADVDMAWQKLRENGSISIKVKKFTDDSDLRKQADAAFDWFKTQLMQDFFKTSMEPPMFLKQGQTGGLLGTLQSLLGPLTQTQQGSSRPVRGQPTTEAPTVAAPPVGANAGMTSLATENQGQVASSGTAGSGSAANRATPGLGIQVGFSLKRIEQDELKERDFDYSEESAVVRPAAPQGLFSTLVAGLDLKRAIREINLDDDFFKRINAEFILGADIEAEKMATVIVNVEYPGGRPEGVQPTQVKGFSFSKNDKTSKRFETFLDDKKNLSYRYKVGVDFTGDAEWIGEEPHYESEWETTTAGSVSVNPFDAFDRFDLEVLLSKEVPATVKQAQVELVYEDPGTGFKAARTMNFVPGDPSQHWKLRFKETNLKTFKSRVTFFMENNLRVEGAWVQSEPITTESGSLVINSPFRNEISVRVVPMLDQQDIADASVELVYREDDTGYEHRASIAYTPADAPTVQVVRIPTISPTPDGVIVTKTVVRADGSVFAGEPETVTGTATATIVSDGPRDVRKIKVKLASNDFAAAGLIAVRVRLVAAVEDGDRDEVFFAGAVAEETVTLALPDEGHTYSFEVIGYTPLGVPRVGLTGTTADNPLVIPLP